MHPADVLELLMPRRCVFCGTRTPAQAGFICPGCLGDLPVSASPAPRVGSPLARIVVPLVYEFPVDAAIKAFKFRRRLYYTPAFTQLLRAASVALPDDIDAVVPVPLHWRRQWRRGFNQAHEIGKPLARHLGVPLVRKVVRRRATPPQSGLSAHARARNLRRAFAIRGRLRYRHPLIVDDVVTTGATIEELARVLRRGGADEVSAIAIART